jgi:predicted ATPase/tetratricopeptide (TPR) repeat protein/DNA-binding CsgD family transcriptional regulator
LGVYKRGRVYYNEAMNGRDPDQFSPPQPLTEREQDVLTLIGDGLTNREIAERLTVAMSTVKWYVRQVYNKLGADHREEAIARGRQLGLLATAARPGHNLPPQPTPFVGRQAELAALDRYLTDPTLHLITISGIGGMGKTRLALAAAHAQVNSRQRPHPFPHGVYFVSLADLETAERLAPVIAVAIGFGFNEGSEPETQLLRYLSQKAMLIVLDNFEQAPAGLDLVNEIRQTAPAVKLLVTSRTRLNLQAEQLFPISGLDFPDEERAGDEISLKRLSGYSAIQLFSECGRRSQPDFTLTTANQADVLAICRLVQGMPLGIVLAAAWSGTLTLPEIAAEMGQNLDFLASDMVDMPARQRSLRGAFEHSWRMLSRQEQAVFACLSVFRGGFSREAAQPVAGASLRDLQTLLNKSLLHRSPAGRYEIHKLLQQFAAEKLDSLLVSDTAAGSNHAQEIQPVSQIAPEVYGRHSAYFATYLQEQGARWRATWQFETFKAITEEIDNIRQAWGRAVAKPDPALVQQMAAELFWYYDRHSQYHEGKEQFQLAIDCFCPSRQPDTAWQTGLLLRWARFLTRLADYETARPVFVEATRFLRQSQEQLELALALNFWGDLERLCGDYDLARSLLAESLQLYREANNSFDLARTLNHLAMVIQRQGEYSLSIEYANESLTLCQLAGDQRGIAAALYSLGYATYELGDHAAAEAFYRQSLALRRDLGDSWGTAAVYNNLGIIYYDRGDYDQAEESWQHCLAIRQELGDARGTAVIFNNLGLIAGVRQAYHQAGQWYRQSLHLCRQMDNRQGVSIALNNLGEIAASEGRYEQAYEYHQESLAVAREIAYTRSIIFALDFLGQVATRLSRLEEAQGYYLEALRLAWESQAQARALQALHGLATVFWQSGQTEKAAALWGLVARHPSTEDTTRGPAQAMLAEHFSVGPDAWAVATDLDQVVDDLLRSDVAVNLT